MSFQISPDIQLIRRAALVRPNYSQIARDLGVSPQHVRRVFLGLSTSARVMEAIQERMRKQKSKRGGKSEVAA